MLRKYAFIVAILGIAFLLGLLILSPKELGSLDELDSMEINEKVMLKGKVGSERDFGDFRIWKLSVIEGDTEIDFEVICDCKESYLGREIEIVGLVSEFNGERQVRVLRVLTKND